MKRVKQSKWDRGEITEYKLYDIEEGFKYISERIKEDNGDNIFINVKCFYTDKHKREIRIDIEDTYKLYITRYE